MSEDARLRRLLTVGRFHLDPTPLVMVSVDRSRPDVYAILGDVGDSFAAAIFDDLEITLVLPARLWAGLAARGEEAPAPTSVRLITFDQLLPHDLVGFTAVVSAALAAAGISVLPLAANQRDHFMVAAEDGPRALATLQSLR